MKFPLGRKPSPQDDRDYDLADYLDVPEVEEAPQVEELDEAVAPLSGDDPISKAYNDLLSNASVAPKTKAWARLVTIKLVGDTPSPSPAPAPVPVPTGKSWNIVPRLNQGDTPHCVGFGWADWGNSDPVNDSFTNDDGNAIYYECKVIDGEPNAEDGSDVRSGAKAMLNRKRLSAYAFAKSLDVAEQWVLTKGPIVIGSDWTEDMFTPDKDGYIKPTGDVAGGHCYLWSGVLENGDYEFTNSWGNGTDWPGSLNGQFKMTKADFASLYSSNGEACASVELPN